MLYNAAMQGRRSAQRAPYYPRSQERGMSSTAALVALSRKLAKVSYALLRTDTGRSSTSSSSRSGTEGLLRYEQPGAARRSGMS
jgi:hypothetical protein